MTVPGRLRGQFVDPVEHPGERDGAQFLEHQEDGQRQADVTDPVHDEGLLRGGRGGRPIRPEPDQQVGRQADTLPAGVQRDERVAEHQQQHGRDEQVQVGEELAPVRVVRHVADGIDVDQRADAGDQQHEGQRQRVDEQAKVDVQRSGLDPGEDAHLVHPVGGRLTQHVQEHHEAEHERRDHGRAADQVADPVEHPAADQQHDRTGQRQRDEQHRRPVQTRHWIISFWLNSAINSVTRTPGSRT